MINQKAIYKSFVIDITKVTFLIKEIPTYIFCELVAGYKYLFLLRQIFNIF